MGKWQLCFSNDTGTRSALHLRQHHVKALPGDLLVKQKCLSYYDGHCLLVLILRKAQGSAYTFILHSENIPR